MRRPQIVSPSAQATCALGGEPLLDRLLRLAGARPHHRVCVCGPDGLEALLALDRLGYGQACCVSAAPCPWAGDAPCDLLLLTGPLAPAAFAATLARALPRLREGGVLAAAESGLRDDALIVQVLEAFGMTAGWRVHDMADGCLVALQVVRAGEEMRFRAA